MTKSVRAEGPTCPTCGAASYRAVRMHRDPVSDHCYLVAIRWACSQCGNRFTDPVLDEFNAQARVAARTPVRREAHSTDAVGENARSDAA